MFENRTGPGRKYPPFRVIAVVPLLGGETDILTGEVVVTAIVGMMLGKTGAEIEAVGGGGGGGGDVAAFHALGNSYLEPAL